MKESRLHTWLTALLNWTIRFWWLFPLVTILCIAGALLVIDCHPVVGLILCGISILTLAVQLPVFIILLIKKKWWRAVGAFFAGIVSFLGVAAIPALFLGMFFNSLPDDFGKEHPIPEGLEYNMPLGCITEEGDTVDSGESEFLGWVKVQPVIDSTDTASWLQIWHGMQGGIYEYSLYWPALEDGEVYLRCFEVTQNVELSVEQIRRRTARQVSGHQEFGQIVDQKDFTIYEGDWEEYYAVRVEVWHKPTHGKPHKLMQKVYRMEGWMR